MARFPAVGYNYVAYLSQRIWFLNEKIDALAAGSAEGKLAQYPGRMALYRGYSEELAMEIYAGADMLLMPSKSEPCGLSQMIALRYGTVPIVRETGGLKDSISDSGDGKGNGFTFQTYDSQDMLGAVRRAIAGYWNEEGGWKVLMKRAMECDNSWGKSANEYIRLYRAMLKE